VKKLHKLFIITGVVLVVIALGYQLIVARVSTRMFDTMKYNTFQLGMSSIRAKSLFSSYGELTKMSTEKEDYGILTRLTFENKRKGAEFYDEQLTLRFVNDKLSGFCYHNIGIPFE